MGKTITFGKWQGWDTDRLAQSGSFGRDYLAWGADNLRSPEWRKEFSRALSDNQEMSASAIEAAIKQNHPDLLPELDQEIRMEIREWQGLKEVNEATDKLTADFQAQLKAFGVSEEGVEYLTHHHYEITDLLHEGRLQFTDEAKKRNVVALCEKYTDELFQLEM